MQSTAHDTPVLDWALARLAWQTLEPYHAMIYFAPEARAAFTAAGLKGFWMGYFASRAASMGAVPAEVVVAAFYNFQPGMVVRAIPDAWRFSTPERVLAARLQAADEALRRLLGDALEGTTIAEAATLARQAAQSCDPAGRALFAGHASLPWPEPPHLALWHAATLLREFRGDGHVAALLSEGIDGCEAHLTMAGTGAASREVLQPARGWTDEQWAAAQARLARRGILDDAGTLTEQGHLLRQAVEDRTDQLALPPWQALGTHACRRLLDLVRPLSTLIVERGGVPMPSPLGLPWPPAAASNDSTSM